MSYPPRRTRWSFKFSLLAAAAALSVVAGRSGAETAYWIRPTNNFVLDRQSARLIASHSRLVVLRARAQGSSGEHDYRALVSQFHQTDPRLHVVMYSLATTAPIPDSIDGLVSSSLAAGPNFLVRSKAGGPMPGFPDPTNADYQDRFVNRVAAIADQMGVDGIALDESFRVPRVFPRRLAARCSEDPEFCTSYARGVDELYSRVKKAIGSKLFLYNGIWNVYPGMPEDQAALLRSADAAAIEMFGGDPSQHERSFSSDILPYLKIATAHEDKKFLFFGRASSYGYQSYEDDYLRQRYLYCAYLLVQRDGTYFKYLATFEAPATAGLRTGGVDTYFDWSLGVGSPLGPYSQHNGVYSREYQNAIVYVAPDDGPSAQIDLPGTFFTPEGEAASGTTTLAPGTGLLLFKTRPPAIAGESEWTAAAIPGAQSMGSLQGQSPRYLNVPEPGMPPSDVLLDAVRTLHPRSHLDVAFRFDDPRAKILAIAEVDDDSGVGHSPYAIVEIAHGDPRRGQIYAPSAQYRIPQGSAPGGWRLIPVEASGPPGQWQHIKIGPEDFSGPEGAGLHFRRWAYLRLDGPLSFASARLTQ